MDKEKSNTNLFTKSGCLSQEGIIKYIEGSLDKNDMHIVEMHTVDCQLCSDAIDGLSEIDKNKLEEIFNKVRSGKDIKRKRFNSWIVYTSIAAAIGILIISAVITTNFNKIANKEETVFLKEAKTSEENSENVKTKDLPYKEKLMSFSEDKRNNPEGTGYLETVSANEKKGYRVTESFYYNEDAENKPQFESIKGDSIVETILPKTTTGKAEEKDNSGGELIDKLCETKKTSGEVNDLTIEQEKKGAKRTKNKSAEKNKMEQKVVGGNYDQDAKQDEDLISVLGEGISLYNSSQYKEAIIKFEYLIKAKFQNCDAKYYCALSYFKINNSKSALKQLDDLTSDSKNLCYEKAIFQKALILKSTGRDSDAEKIFKTIIEENGDYSDDAAKELNKMH